MNLLSVLHWKHLIFRGNYIKCTQLITSQLVTIILNLRSTLSTFLIVLMRLSDFAA